MARYTVGTSTDDSQQIQSGACDPASLNLTLTVPANPYAGIRFSSVFRFTGLGAIVMQLAADTTKNFDMDADVYCEAADSAATFTTTTNDISTRARTTTSIIWKATLRSGPNVYSTSPDLTPIVMEVMNRAGWVDGGPINFIFVARSSSICVINAQDNSKNNPPFIDLLPSAPPFDTREAPGHQAPSSAFEPQFLKWGVPDPAPPAYPFADQRSSRTVRGFRPPPGRVAQPRWPQQNPPIPIQETARFKPLRGLLRRGHSAEPVWPQRNPPYPWAEVVRPKPLRGLLRRGRTNEYVRPQIKPPVVETTQPRRPRGFLSRRGRSAEVVPAQIVVPTSPLAPSAVSQPRRIRGMLSRRGRSFETVRPQVNPPYPWTSLRRTKVSFLRRVVRKSEVVPPQERPTLIVQQRKIRGALRFPGRRAETVRPQVNPPYPISAIVQPRRIRGMLTRRSRPIEVVPGQVAVPPTVLTPSVVSQPRRIRGMLSRRGRVATPVRAQVNPPMPTERRSQPQRIRGLLPRRTRKAEPVRAQVNPPYPAETKRQPRRVRGMLRRLTRRFDGYPGPPVVTSVPAGSAIVTILGSPAVTITMAGAPSASVAINPPYAATITMSAGLSATVTLNDAPRAQID